MRRQASLSTVQTGQPAISLDIHPTAPIFAGFKQNIEHSWSFLSQPGLLASRYQCIAWERDPGAQDWKTGLDQMLCYEIFWRFAQNSSSQEFEPDSLPWRSAWAETGYDSILNFNFKWLNFYSQCSRPGELSEVSPKSSPVGSCQHRLLCQLVWLQKILSFGNGFSNIVPEYLNWT